VTGKGFSIEAREEADHHHHHKIDSNKLKELLTRANIEIPDCIDSIKSEHREVQYATGQLALMLQEYDLLKKYGL
jgi:hypothetical protein